MICALLCGRGGSKGVPHKNVLKVLGKPLMMYPLLAANHAKQVDKLFVTTDSHEIARLAKKYDATIIRRPPELATDEALLEDVIVHGFYYLTETLKHPLEFMVILLCNAATVQASSIDKAVALLRKNPEADSAASVNLLNQYSPARAKKTVNGRLENFIDLSFIGKEISCDRKSQGDCYFSDASLWVIRPRCILNIKDGQLPFKWMGKNIIPIENRWGLDVDDEEGFVLTEFWLKRNGFTRTSTPYDKVKKGKKRK